MSKLASIACLWFLFSMLSFSVEPPSFKYGLGGGVNFSNIQVAAVYPLYEDLSGAEYASDYSLMFSNLGSQFFFHGEFDFKHIVLAFKPGAYTYKFSRTDEIVFNEETSEVNSTFLLRYFQMPVEAKWIMGSGTFKPYIGLEGSFGYLLRQGGSGNHSFIHPRFSAGPIVGSYYSFENIDLVFTVSYDYGLHIINDKADRYNTTSGTSYSQSDIKLHALSFSLSVLFSMDKSKARKGLDCVYPNNRKP